MKMVLVTGAHGFIGKNLLVHLRERKDVEVLTFVRGEDDAALAEKVARSDVIFHLAGVNRPQEEREFAEGNAQLTERLCAAVEASGRPIALVCASSIQAGRDNPYGNSKRSAEEALADLARRTGAAVSIYRLPNVFGKWCRPNYNSAVATFCHNIAHDLPIRIDDPAAALQLVYIDDVVAAFMKHLDGIAGAALFLEVDPVHSITVGELAKQLYRFKGSRDSGLVEPVGNGLVRALYSTYITYYTPQQFTYPLVKHEDPRGVFVEMLKTADSGQFSYFTAKPGVTRGGHYHHSKTEKFLVISGAARFRFLQIDTGETYERSTDGSVPEVVETVPGWSHDITNVGEGDMVVMLWANEIFDRSRPDTVAYQVNA